MENSTIEVNSIEVPIIYIGDSKFCGYETRHLKTDSQLVFAITDYTYSDYVGNGVMFAKGSLGEWYKWDLGHCSCYGPLENGYSGRFTEQEILILAEREGKEIFEEIKKFIYSK